MIAETGGFRVQAYGIRRTWRSSLENVSLAAAPVDRAVEIGYEVAPEFRGRGFGAAAARALVDVAVASGEVDHVVAHTLPGPNASTGVLVALAFGHVADQIPRSVWSGNGDGPDR